MSYTEQLKNPAWQRKRLEILERDSFTCQLCSDTETELHIHHKFYEKGKKAWQYENSNFMTVCKVCHKTTEFYKGSGYIPIISVKSCKEALGIIIVTTILYNDNKHMIASIDKYFKNGEIENMYVIDNDINIHLSTLFQHAEKLIK